MLLVQFGANHTRHSYAPISGCLTLNPLIQFEGRKNHCALILLFCLAEKSGLNSSLVFVKIAEILPVKEEHEIPSLNSQQCSSLFACEVVKMRVICNLNGVSGSKCGADLYFRGRPLPSHKRLTQLLHKAVLWLEHSSVLEY